MGDGFVIDSDTFVLDPDLLQDTGEIDEDGKPIITLSMDTFRDMLDTMSDRREDWQGLPMPVEGLKLVLNATHPLKEEYAGLWHKPEDDEEDADEERIRNSWFSKRTNAYIFVMETEDGRIYHLKRRYGPLRAMDRFDLQLMTLIASDAWRLEAEHAAMEKLKGMLGERQWRQYELTGSFMEESKRSGVLYMFRRLRPTLALSLKDGHGTSTETTTFFLAALCMHPVGYYNRTWGGCLVPTDDVIAHLVYMRGDEARFWGQSNQHRSWDPESGV